MNLEIIPPHMIDFAWDAGAKMLSSACEESGGEITGDQLKMILSRGERHLVRMVSDSGGVSGWGVFRIDALPNARVMHITDLAAPHGAFESFFDSIKKMAKDAGCSKIRCAAKPAQARLYSAKCGFVPLYQIMEVSTI